MQPIINGNHSLDVLEAKVTVNGLEDKATDCSELVMAMEDIAWPVLLQQEERRDEQMKEQADLIVAMRLERENLLRLIRELQDEVYAAELNRQ